MPRRRDGHAMIQVYVPDRILEKLRMESNLRDRSLSATVRTILRLHYEGPAIPARKIRLRSHTPPEAAQATP